MRIVIIGAGPCGLGAAHQMAELGHTDFAVYDRRPHVGGLAASYKDGAGFTWDFAVHVAHSHYTYFDRLMESVLPGGFLTHERRSWVREYGCDIPYPFQYNIRHLPPEVVWECVEGLIDRPCDPEPPQSFREWILQNVGAGIARHFMLPYNRKIWSVDPALMGIQWMGDRVPETDLKRVLRNVVMQRDDVAWGPNHMFHFPREGGTGAIWEAMAARLPSGSIRLNRELVGLDPRAKTLRFSDGSTDRYDRLISTMPLPILARLVGDEALVRRAGELRHTHVDVACLAYPRPIPKSLAEKTWIYCPEDACCFYRMTPFSIFSPSHVPDVDRWCSFMCEVSRPGVDSPTASDTTVRDCIEGMAQTGLIEPEGEEIHTLLLQEEFGYPVPTLDRDAVLNDLLPAFEQRDILSRGRFGAWKYEVGNMDHSVMQGVEAANRLILGEEEVTWKNPNLVNSGKR